MARTIMLGCPNAAYEVVKRRAGHAWLAWIDGADYSGRYGDDVTAALRPLARDPDLLSRPLAAPLGGDVVVVDRRFRILRCLNLDEVLDLEAVGAEQPDPVAVAEVVFSAV
jgi:hypothetical protein